MHKTFVCLPVLAVALLAAGCGGGASAQQKQDFSHMNARQRDKVGYEAAANLRRTELKEDANFAAFYLSSLAIGVILVSLGGNSVELLHLLFGSVLAVDLLSLQLMGAVASFTIVALAVMFRPLMLESIDPLFLRAVNGRGGLWHVAFLILVVMNLVAGFQALGTLMSVGLMMLPSITARLWAKSMGALMALSVFIALVCGFAGLLFSYHVEIPSGPAIILCCGVLYAVSLVFGREGGILGKWFKRRKHKAL